MSFRSARVKSGTKVSHAAEALGVTSPAIYQWESGRTIPDAKRLPAIAKLYGCSIDELLSPDEE